MFPLTVTWGQAIRAWCIADKADAISNLPNEIDNCNSPGRWQTNGPNEDCFAGQADDLLVDLTACCSLAMVPFPREPSEACMEIAMQELPDIPETCLDPTCWAELKGANTKWIESTDSGLPVLFSECANAPGSASCSKLTSAASEARKAFFTEALTVLGDAQPCIPPSEIGPDENEGREDGEL